MATPPRASPTRTRAVRPEATASEEARKEVEEEEEDREAAEAAEDEVGEADMLLSTALSTSLTASRGQL